MSTPADVAAPGGDAGPPLERARAALAAGRAALLAALGPLTELDFNRRIAGGGAIVAELVHLAAAERALGAALAAGEEPAAASAASDQPAARPRSGSGRTAAPGPGERLLPPQAVHQLAGARYATEALLARLAAETATAGGEADAAAAPTASAAQAAHRYLALAARETALAAAIVAAVGEGVGDPVGEAVGEAVGDALGDPVGEAAGTGRTEDAGRPGTTDGA